MGTTSVDRASGLLTGTAIKAPCVTATTANITLSGLQTINGVAVAADDRVLVKDQTDATENGIYIAKSTAWVRAADFNGNRDAVYGTLVPVAYAAATNVFFQLTTSGPITIGTSSLTFTNITGPVQTAGDIGDLIYPRSTLESTNVPGTPPPNTEYIWGDVRRWGAVGNGSTDDTTALQNCAASGHEFTGPAEFDCIISGDIDLRGVPVNFPGRINRVANTAKVLLGGTNSSDRPQPRQYIYKVYGSTGIFSSSESEYDVEVRGTKDQEVRVDAAGTIRLYARNTNNSDGSIAYSDFHFRHFGNLLLENEGVGSSGATYGGWINENKFHLGQGKVVRLKGDYAHNNNRFYGGTFEESGSVIDIQTGRDNAFYDARLENFTSNTIAFGHRTFRNMVIVNWTSSDSNYPPFVAEYTDYGIGNQVISGDEGSYQWTTIASIAYDTLKVDNDAGPTVYSIEGVGLNDATNPFTRKYLGDVIKTAGQLQAASNSFPYLSPLIPVSRRGSSIIAATMLDSSGPIDKLRSFITGYDSGASELTSNSQNVSAVTQGDTTVITTSGPHGFSVGERVYFDGLGGLQEGGNSIINHDSSENQVGWFSIEAADSTTLTIGLNSNAATAYTTGGTVKYADYQLRGISKVFSFEPESGPSVKEGSDQDRVMATILRHDCHYIRIAIRNGSGAQLFDRLTVAIRNPVDNAAPERADTITEGNRRALNLLPHANPIGFIPCKSGAGTPTATSTVPDFLGQMYADTSANKGYICTTLSSPPVVGDWTILNPDP